MVESVDLTSHGPKNIIKRVHDRDTDNFYI